MAVVLSSDLYEHLEKLDDAYWAAEVTKVKKRGDFLNPEESEEFLSSILDETGNS